MARIRNALAYATHRFFQERGFLYVHTPIVTASDCEGAGEMFQVGVGWGACRPARLRRLHARVPPRAGAGTGAVRRPCLLAGRRLAAAGCTAGRPAAAL